MSTFNHKPEEIVRQGFLQKMIGELGFPKSLISVEKQLSSAKKDRRFDILVQVPGGDGLKALVLVECKAKEINKGAFEQALGYNRTIKAPFLCLTNGKETKTFWLEKGKMVSVPFLPSFSELYKSIC